MIVDKPWGKVTTYALNQPGSVRLIRIDPGQETSEHYHQLREEMWVVLDEGLRIQIGNKTVQARVGDEFIVSSEEPHRITNTSEAAGRVLEIAFGYTTEEDTFRLRDDYGRPLDQDW